MIRLLIMFFTISYAHADILEREDVQNFIELAVNSSELTKEEIENFINSLTADQFEKITEYIQNIPSMKYTANFNCEKCK